MSAMSKPQSIIRKVTIRPSLFWDVDCDALDLEEHARFILTRTFERGTIEEVRNCLTWYGEERAKAQLTQTRWLSPIALSFCCCIFDLKEEYFRCYRLRQALPNLGNW